MALTFLLFISTFSFSWSEEAVVVIRPERNSVVSEIVSLAQALAEGARPHFASVWLDKEISDTPENRFLLSGWKPRVFKTYSVDEIQRAFTAYATSPEIPKGIFKNGCEARAHKLSLLLQEADIKPFKVFARGKLRPENQTWNYHAAVLLPSASKENPDWWVLDPSLAKEALPLMDWYFRLAPVNEDAPLTLYWPVPSFINHTEHVKVFITPAEVYLDQDSPLLIYDENYQAQALKFMNISLKENFSKSHFLPFTSFHFEP